MVFLRGDFFGFFFLDVLPPFLPDATIRLPLLPLPLPLPFALLEVREFEIAALGNRSGSRKTSMGGQPWMSKSPCTLEGRSGVGIFDAWSMLPEGRLVIVHSCGRSRSPLTIILPLLSDKGN